MLKTIGVIIFEIIALIFVLGFTSAPLVILFLLQHTAKRRGLFLLSKCLLSLAWLEAIVYTIVVIAELRERGHLDPDLVFETYIACFLISICALLVSITIFYHKRKSEGGQPRLATIIKWTVIAELLLSAYAFTNLMIGILKSQKDWIKEEFEDVVYHFPKTAKYIDCFYGGPTLSGEINDNLTMRFNQNDYNTFLKRISNDKKFKPLTSLPEAYISTIEDEEIKLNTCVGRSYIKQVGNDDVEVYLMTDNHTIHFHLVTTWHNDQKTAQLLLKIHL